jgi:triosephosphate isomerase
MKYVVGNWKMHLTVRESVALARGVMRSLRGSEKLPEIILCPATTALSDVRKASARSRVKIGAQNAGVSLRAGAFTGEISPQMLEDVGASYVLLGHSERRHIFGETDALVRERMDAVLESKLMPMLCIGETSEQNNAGETEEALMRQIRSALSNAEFKGRSDIFIAYEPVWAIGTGKTPLPEQIAAVHKSIRAITQELTSNMQVHVLYGGSVNAENAYSFLRESEIDGVLVGGASLKLYEFTGIVNAAKEVMLQSE